MCRKWQAFDASKDSRHSKWRRRTAISNNKHGYEVVWHAPQMLVLHTTSSLDLNTFYTLHETRLSITSIACVKSISTVLQEEHMSLDSFSWKWDRFHDKIKEMTKDEAVTLWSENITLWIVIDAHYGGNMGFICFIFHSWFHLKCFRTNWITFNSFHWLARHFMCHRPR